MRAEERPRTNGAAGPPVNSILVDTSVAAPIWAEMDRKIDRIQRTLYILAAVVVIAWCLLTVVVPLLVDIIPALATYGQP